MSLAQEINVDDAVLCRSGGTVASKVRSCRKEAPQGITARDIKCSRNNEGMRVMVIDMVRCG